MQMEAIEREATITTKRLYMKMKQTIIIHKRVAMEVLRVAGRIVST